MTLYLIRGLPGSGKSTLARKLVSEHNICEADQFFSQTGEYIFDKEKLPQAHLWCQAKCASRLIHQQEPIVVANTFIKRWELERYYQMAREAGWNVVEITVKGPFKSIHGVPPETIKRMQAQFEP
jgi:predicted kinase